MECSGFAIELCRGVYYGVWRLERAMDQRVAAGSFPDMVLHMVDRGIGNESPCDSESLLDNA